MSKSSATSAIRLRGVRHNNLKHFDLDLPTNQLIVVTGPSGSGKSSLAFDTLYAEGQRRYIETFSPYARQFFDRMDKPQVDSIRGIPPAIAIEQRNTVKTTRSTVGTMTEICDYMKVIWSHLAELHCQKCGAPIRKEPPQAVWKALLEDKTRAGKSESEPEEILITFDLPLSSKLSLAESLNLLAKQGYQRILLPKNTSAGEAAADEFEVIRVDEAIERFSGASWEFLRVLQDRLRPLEEHRSRFVEACEQAYHFGKGRLSIYSLSGGPPRRFSNRFHCAACNLDGREPVPALFSFNHPLGACPACRGFGRIITIDYNSAIPDRTLSLRQGAVKPWQSGQSAGCQEDLLKFCRRRGVPPDVPFEELSATWQKWVLEGDPEYGKDARHEWPHAWYGIKGYFRWLESKAYKLHVRVLLSRYRSYRTCPDCQGQRFQPDSLQYRLQGKGGWMTLADFYRLPVQEALGFVGELRTRYRGAAKSDPFLLALEEVQSRLGYLVEVGLGYLSLDRPTRSLSGGETERVNLTTCLGSRLVNTLFVLDEPSVGLHHRDTARLVQILHKLRDTGNTVVVVEHEASVMRAADQIVDLGPGHGESGGYLVFQGSPRQILDCADSLTGQYLSGRKRVDASVKRHVTPGDPALTLSHATLHNLKELAVSIPLQRLVCVTGVSGSGKTTLVRDLLLPCLEATLKRAKRGSESQASVEDDSDESESLAPIAHRESGARVVGTEHLGRAILVDQSPIGKTPRSNPAVYIGAFDHIREFFAQTDVARQRGLNASAFSFNSAQGQCELCRGAGFEKVEMQFLSDVYIRCGECDGRRYRPHILDLKVAAPATAQAGVARAPSKSRSRKLVRRSEEGWNISDVLQASVDEAIAFLSLFVGSRPAQRAVRSLALLQEVGLGYLRLGQPINTLSGGESQRLKLVSHLAEFAEAAAEREKPTLFLFDEPTTGLHFDDVRILLKVFQRLVDAGHSVLVIEHNLDVIKAADWIIDLGPEGGSEGGQVVMEGPPERVAACPQSHTGAALAKEAR